MSTNSIKGRPACETLDCYPDERYPDGKVKTVKWVPKFQSWLSVYRVFESIAYTILELPESIDHIISYDLISSTIDSLYAQHKGDDAWDTAYAKWIETLNSEVD